MKTKKVVSITLALIFLAVVISFFLPEKSVRKGPPEKKDIEWLESQVENLFDIDFIKIENQMLYLCDFSKEANMTMVSRVNLSKIKEISFSDNEIEGCLLNFNPYPGLFANEFKIIEGSIGSNIKSLNYLKAGLNGGKNVIKVKGTSLKFNSPREISLELRFRAYKTIKRISKRYGGCGEIKNSKKCKK